MPVQPEVLVFGIKKKYQANTGKSFGVAEGTGSLERLRSFPSRGCCRLFIPVPGRTLPVCFRFSDEE